MNENKEKKTKSKITIALSNWLYVTNDCKPHTPKPQRLGTLAA